jgi:hypothetical protein
VQIHKVFNCKNLRLLYNSKIDKHLLPSMFVAKLDEVAVNRPTICQSVRMGRLYSQDSKPKVS